MKVYTCIFYTDLGVERSHEGVLHGFWAFLGLFLMVKNGAVLPEPRNIKRSPSTIQSMDLKTSTQGFEGGVLCILHILYIPESRRVWKLLQLLDSLDHLRQELPNLNL